MNDNTRLIRRHGLPGDALAPVALAARDGGGNAGSPGVAHAASPSASTSSSPGSSVSRDPLAFPGACMRTGHGLPRLGRPDPGQPGSDLDPDNPTYQAARPPTRPPGRP